MAWDEKKVEINEVPEEVKSFALIDFDDLEKQTYTDLYKELGSLRIEDYRWRNRNRGCFGYIILALLIIQNIAVFSVLIWALLTGAAERLQILLPIVVPATLLETAAMVQIVLRFIFNEVDYTISKPH